MRPLISKLTAAGAAILLALLSMPVAMLPLRVLAQDIEPSREQLIKAAFLYNFTKFVEWPAQSFTGPHDPLVIGVLGESASSAVLASALEQTVKGRSVNGRSVIVKRIDSIGEAVGVHVLFLPASDEARLRDIGTITEHHPILTVGESPSFAHAGGAINFFLEEDKVRFEINAASAERAGLRISAQLLKLAKPPRTDRPISSVTHWSSHAPVS